MPVFHTQNVLNGGEISPLLRGRVDQPRYSTGAREMRNFVPMPQGGVTRRPGTRYLETALGDGGRLVPFVFSATQGRMLEFGDRAMRVWLPDGRVVADEEGAPKIFESPFAAADLRAVRYAQSADVIYFAHPGYAPRKLARHADDDWRWSELTFMPAIATPKKPTLSTVGTPEGDKKTDYTYCVTAIDDKGQESSPSEPASISAQALNSVDFHIRISWEAVEGATGYRVYKKKMGVFGYIGKGDADETHIDDKNIGADTEDTPPEYEDPFEGEDNYPSQVFFHQQRLGFAASNSRPITIWLSRSGEFESMAKSTPPKDDDAIEVTLAATQASRIVWLQPDRSALAFGTEGSEWTLEPSEGVALTPATASFQLQTTNGGSDAVAALSVGGSVLYVQRGAGAIREFAYNYSADKYLGQDLNILARHMLRDVDVVAWSWQQEPYAVLWSVLSDGTLAGLTYMKEQEIVGWHRHTTAGDFVDVAGIPGTPDDQVWFLVRRGGQVFVERLEPFFDSDDLAEAYYLDSALDYQGEAAARFDGLVHLAGQAVQVFADGGTIDGLEVSADGSLTLGQAATSVHVGLPYVSRVVPNLPELQTQQGWSLMHDRKILAVRARVYRSMSFLAGVGDSLAPIIDRDITGGLFATTPFFSEGTDLDLDTCAGWSAASPLVFQVQSATPLTILALVTTLEISPYTGGGTF